MSKFSILSLECRKIHLGLRSCMRRVTPAKLVLLGYASYVLLGWACLTLPWAQRQEPASSLDHLFIATSAVSTTGLVTLSVADQYNWFGQAVVLLLIQLGGIGYMTFGSFVILARQRNLSRTQVGIVRTVFTLPESFHLASFIRSVVGFTLVIETIGALTLYVLFRQAGLPQTGWSAVFHSVSAFCTAGFSLYNDSFASQVGNFWINAVIALLSYLGAVGFIVCLDAWNVLTRRSPSMTLTSRIILWATFWLSAGGAALLFLTEPTLQTMPADQRWLAAFFQAMTALTTVGFNTIDIGAMSHASILLLIVLMVIGSSPSGTGGGLKCTTFSALLGVMRSAARGERTVHFWGRTIPLERIWAAGGIAGFYVLSLVVGVYLLELTEPTGFDQNFFEAASALGTVGLSMGITAGLTNLGKLIIIAMMFCGRLGPLTLGMALFTRTTSDQPRLNDDLAV